MKARSIILAATTAIAMMAAIPDALANGYHRDHGYERPHWRPHHPHWQPYGYYAPPPRVYYAPPPVYYAPPPVVYFRPRGW